MTEATRLLNQLYETQKLHEAELQRIASELDDLDGKSGC